MEWQRHCDTFHPVTPQSKTEDTLEICKLRAKVKSMRESLERSSADNIRQALKIVELKDKEKTHAGITAEDYYRIMKEGMDAYVEGGDAATKTGSKNPYDLKSVESAIWFHSLLEKERYEKRTVGIEGLEKKLKEKEGLIVTITAANNTLELKLYAAEKRIQKDIDESKVTRSKVAALEAKNKQLVEELVRIQLTPPEDAFVNRYSNSLLEKIAECEKRIAALVTELANIKKNGPANFHELLESGRRAFDEKYWNLNGKNVNTEKNPCTEGSLESEIWLYGLMREECDYHDKRHEKCLQDDINGLLKANEEFKKQQYAELLQYEEGVSSPNTVTISLAMFEALLATILDQVKP